MDGIIKVTGFTGIGFNSDVAAIKAYIALAAKKLVDDERERCAGIADEAAALLRRGVGAVPPMQQPVLETTAELCDSLAARIRSGQ